MKFRVLFLAAVAALSVSCNKEADWDGPGADTFAGFTAKLNTLETSEVSFTKAAPTQRLDNDIYLHSYECDWLEEAGAETRSAPVSAVHNTFAVSAYASHGTWSDGCKPNLFYKETMTKSGGSWSGNAQIMWPGSDYKVRFVAVSPAQATGLSWTSSSTDAGLPVITYTVQSTAADQLDLLEAVSADYNGDGTGSGSGLSLTFNHVLTAVCFKVSDFVTSGTVKSVTISGIKNAGSHVVGSGTWTSLTGNATYSLTELNAIFTATGDYAVTDGENTLLLMPQTLAEDASITVVMTVGGSDKTLRASLAGKTWLPGKKVVYTLSSSDENWLSSSLDISDVTALAEAAATNVAVVKSYREHALGFTEAVPWTVTYSEDGGETFSATRPEWLTAFTAAGNGGTSGETVSATASARTNVTLTTPPTFGTEQGSPSNYIDLSMVNPITRQSMARETANSYIVNAPGYYKIPLFYGNAIKNGSANTAAYPLAPANDDSYDYARFYNAYGEEIGRSGGSGNIATDIASHTLNTSGGRLVWCTGNANLLSVDANLENGGDGVYYLKFRVPSDYIKEGNAVIGVLKNGSADEFIWSWHIWIVSNEMALQAETYTNEASDNIDMLNWALGATRPINTGKPRRSCIVRVAQNIAGGESRDFTVSQSAVITAAGNPSNTFYQFGRPNALPPTTVTDASTGIYYPDGAGCPDGAWYWSNGSAAANMNVWLSKPYQAYFSDSSPHGSGNQYNLWDATQTGTGDKAVVKTVYDPCPAGFSVPRKEAYTYFTYSNKVGSFSKGWYFKKSSSDATGSYWSASGCRYSGLAPSGVGTGGFYWSAAAYNSIGGNYLFFNSGGMNPQNSYYSRGGFSVRPAVCTTP